MSEKNVIRKASHTSTYNARMHDIRKINHCAVFPDCKIYVVVCNHNLSEPNLCRRSFVCGITCNNWVYSRTFIHASIVTTSTFRYFLTFEWFLLIWRYWWQNMESFTFHKRKTRHCKGHVLGAWPLQLIVQIRYPIFNIIVGTDIGRPCDFRNNWGRCGKWLWRDEDCICHQTLP